MAHDPAKTPKRTKEELLKVYQKGCKEIPCNVIEKGRLKCPFCPHIKQYFLDAK